MARIFAVLLLMCTAVQALAQTAETTDKSRLETWLEEALSAAGREVRITGFAGAFSSEASFEQLTIADDDGIWLKVEQAKLNWSRAALLSGRLDINEISADAVSLLRRPLPGPVISTQDSQSWTFQVPELPVSIEIDKIAVGAIHIDPSVIGEEVAATLAGQAQLADGAMSVKIDATRTGKMGRFALEAEFANTTRHLDLDLALQEPTGGLAATLLNLPGAPALDLTLAGSAPLSDFTARLSLKTDQIDRLSGKIHFREVVAEANGTQEFGANLSGDLRPLFAPEFHPFFGTRSELDFAANRDGAGALEVERLHLETGVLKVTGDLVIGPDQLPEAFHLTGEIVSDQPVRLPKSGVPVTLGGLQFQAAFDAAKGDAWSAKVSLTDVQHEGLSVPSLRVTGAGQIDRSLGKQVSGDVVLLADELSFSDPTG